MSLLEGINLGEYEEPVLLQEGDDCEFRVIEALPKVKEETGNKWLNLTLQPINCDNANVPPVYHNIFLPKPQDEPKKKNFKIWQMKSFCDAIDYIPEDGVPRTEEMVGKEGRMIVKYDSNEEYGSPRNEVKKFLKP